MQNAVCSADRSDIVLTRAHLHRPQVEKQFNRLLDACGDFRTDIGAAADVVSLGRAMEQLSSGVVLCPCF